MWASGTPVAASPIAADGQQNEEEDRRNSLFCRWARQRGRTTSTAIGGLWCMCTVPAATIQTSEPRQSRPLSGSRAVRRLRSTELSEVRDAAVVFLTALL
eukprot:Selendium_serpulae@DN6084_c2_g2_i3.p1